jgi:hypothetical protein
MSTSAPRRAIVTVSTCAPPRAIIAGAAGEPG